METKNMAYWKTKNANSPITKKSPVKQEVEVDGGSKGAWGEIGKMVLGKVIDKATERKPSENVVDPTASGFSTMRFGS